MERIRLIVFNMDGTLIRNTDSGLLLCKINDVDMQEIEEINLQEDAGKISGIEADYERAKFNKGNVM